MVTFLVLIFLSIVDDAVRSLSSEVRIIPGVRKRVGACRDSPKSYYTVHVEDPKYPPVEPTV